jgi:hypothetical protein
MSFTPPSASKRTWTSPSADAIKLFARLSVDLSLAACVAGCAAGGELHRDYASLAPRVVHVLPVKNETLHQLDKVSFDGLFQSATIGAELHNIPDLLRGSLEEALVRKGYDAASGPAAVPVLPAAPAAANLQATIEAWESEGGGRFDMYLRYRLEMVRIPTGERLYSGVFSSQERADARSSAGGDVVPAIRRSAARALSGLPPAAP